MNLLKKSLGLVIFAVITVVMTTGVADAATCTQAYTNSLAVPSGYGAAYDVSDPSTLLVQGDCSGTTPVLKVGAGSQTQYVYKIGYAYQGGAWQQINLTSSSALISNNWYAGSAQGTLPFTATDLTNWNYIVGYVCNWNGLAWKCGCADTNCTASNWQLQGISIPTTGGGTTTTAIFDDEFDTLSLHRAWQSGDNWQLIAPDSPDGRGGPNWGEGGSMWWVNPYNPSTLAPGVYSVASGQLVLGLLPTPAATQSTIDTQAGTHLPFVGAILNTSPTNYQHYGYWDFGMSCDRVPGLSCEISMENVQVTGHWPPQLNLGVSTDGSGNQTLQASVHVTNASHDYSQPIDGTKQHEYAIDWESDFITFYLDSVKIFQVANPGGVYQTDKMFTYLYTGANYSPGTGVNPQVSLLPAYAHIDYFRIYTAKP